MVPDLFLFLSMNWYSHCLSVCLSAFYLSVDLSIFLYKWIHHPHLFLWSLAVNECAVTKPCKNGATCVDLKRGYQCLCAPGFTGKDCEQGILMQICNKKWNELKLMNEGIHDKDWLNKWMNTDSCINKGNSNADDFPTWVNMRFYYVKRSLWLFHQM